MTEQFKQFHNIINSGINNDSRTIIAVDNFYTDPDAVRDFSINNFNFEASQWHKGQRSHEKLIVDGTKENCDTQQYAAVVFLTPNAPPESGTNFYRSKLTGKTRFEKWENNGSREYDITFQNGNYYDKTKLELIDKIGNVYNRLVIFDAHAIHAASEYFGDTKLNSRYFHMFFFDCDNP